MILFEKNNGTWKIPPDIFGKAFGVWHSLGEGATSEPYNEALKLVGLPKVDSLDVILANSEMCTALAGNAEACGIMKENYTVDMTLAIDSTLWNEGLNLLNYKCTLKCYLYHSGNTCDAITNGWAVYPTDGEISFNADHIKIAGYSECTVHTGQQIDMTGYKKLVSHQTGYQWVTGYGYAVASVKFGHGQSRVNHEYNVSQGANTPQGRNDGDHPIHKATLIVDAKQGSAFVKGTVWGAVVNDMSPKGAMYIYNVYLEPPAGFAPYTVFNVTTESMENAKGEIVNWHSGRYSIVDDTITVTSGDNKITCNRTGKLHVYMKGRNSTGVGNTCALSLYKNGTKVGGITISANTTGVYETDIDVTNGDYLQIKQDGTMDGGLYIQAGSYLEWVQ